ncbi:MAG: TIM barrel protein [Acidimicrobiia bacterium]
MIEPGLCSVTLRTATLDEVARVAAECGLVAIEWGADVHVPPGDVAAIARAAAATAAAGCRVASYGSYLFAAGIPTPSAVMTALDTAVGLGAPNVRVWAGFGINPGHDDYGALIDALAECGAEAEVRGLRLGLEFHGGTPTATVAGTLALLDAVDRPNLFTYWQPPYWRAPTTPESDADEVRALGSRLSHLHVYEWVGFEDRRPLTEGAARWEAVFAAVSDRVPDRVAFLEFVPGDDPEALRCDATTLLRLLA